MDIRDAYTLHQAGRLLEAKAAYEAIVAQAPANFDAQLVLGIVHAQLGQFGEAANSLQKAVALAPGHAEARFNLGLSLLHLNRHADALQSFEGALAIKPDYADALNIRGELLQGQGRLQEAIASFRQAVAANPGFADAHNNLGIAAQELGRLEEAGASFSQAIACDPDFAEAHGNLGAVLFEQGKLELALASLDRALALRPDLANAHYSRGKVLHAQDRRDAAIESYRNSLALKPDYAEALCNLGVVLNESGDPAEAASCLRQAIAFKPDLAVAHNNLGAVLKAAGRPEEALASLQQAISLKPEYAEAHSNLGTVLQLLGRYEAATASYRDALARKPDFAEAHMDLGSVLYDQGRVDAAIESYRRALAVKPDFHKAHSNLLFLYGYQSYLAPREYLAEARAWEAIRLPAPERAAARGGVFKRAPLAGRRLKVGYVSRDFREHPVGYFVEPIFTRHDRSRIELFAYSFHNTRDALTDRLQSAADHWTLLAGMSDASARERMDADGIDVLIDLSGHTAHNRLGMFALRAAPVQAHYLGFFASTGLTEMDYWIGDDIVTPQETDGHFSEQVWRLPRGWVTYAPKADAPPAGWRPAEDGAVWLGSFNALGKLTPATLALWAKVLHALPEGRLLLKTRALADEGNRRRILEALAGHGIATGRIELQDGQATPDWRTHMAYYDRLDIALDPVGAVGGGTTTCDALWMGAPVVSLMGDRMASRMTASMLNALGHPEWIARSEADYVDKVVALARDAGLRKTLRPLQRDRMAQSALCNAGDLAQHLENAYYGMFQRWIDRTKERIPAAT